MLCSGPLLSGTQVSSVEDFSAFAEANESWFREIDSRDVNDLCQRLELSCTSDARGWALLEFPDMFIVFNSTTDKMPAIYFLSAAIKLGRILHWDGGMEINYISAGDPLALDYSDTYSLKDFERAVEFIFRFQNASGEVLSRATFRSFKSFGDGESDNGQLGPESGFSGFVMLASRSIIDFSQIVENRSD